MMRLPGQDEWRLLYRAAVLLVWVLPVPGQAVLSPIVLFLLFLLLAVPYAGTRPPAGGGRDVGARGALAASHHRFLLAPFILALVLAYILNPAVGAPSGGCHTLAVLLLALPRWGARARAVFGVPALGRQVDA